MKLVPPPLESGVNGCGLLSRPLRSSGLNAKPDAGRGKAAQCPVKIGRRWAACLVGRVLLPPLGLVLPAVADTTIGVWIVTGRACRCRSISSSLPPASHTNPQPPLSPTPDAHSLTGGGGLWRGIFRIYGLEEEEGMGENRRGMVSIG